MNKIRTISTRIDAFLKNGDLTNSPTLQKIHNDYCNCLKFLNSRLDFCESLLERGKLGEAVISADKTPSLFDLVPLLKAPNIVEFLDICQMYNLVTPFSLNLVAFKALEKAAKNTDVKDVLLAELRKLSRTQGSEEKVIILRKIIKFEPDNSEWRRQLKQAESTCLPVLIQQAQEAITNQDFTTLEALEESLLSHQWELVIPDVVLNKIRRTLEGEQQRQLNQNAQIILNDIEKAYAKNNFIDFNQALSHWKMLCNIDGYIQSDDEKHRLAIAEAFFQESKKIAAQNEEFDKIISEFNGYIQSPLNVNFEEIQYLYQKLATFNKIIPLNITNFYNQQLYLIEENKRAQLNKIKFNKLLYSIVAILILMVGCTATWFSYNKKILQNDLYFALKKHDFKRAEKLVTSINKSILPYLLFSSNLRSLTAEYELKVQEKNTFATASKKLEDILNSPLDESKKEYIEKLLKECREKGNLPYLQKQLAKLEQLYQNNFVEKIKARQVKTINSHLEKIKNLYSAYIKEVNNASYNKLNTIYIKFLSQLNILKSLSYFEEATLTNEERNIISPFHWLIAKQKSIYSTIQVELKNNNLESIAPLLEMYKDNEQALLTEGTINQITDKKLPSAQELLSRYTLAKNNKLVKDYTKELNKLKTEITLALKKDQISIAEELLQKFKLVYGVAIKTTPISRENAVSLTKVNNAANLSKLIAGKKHILTVNTTIKKHISNLNDEENRNALTTVIEEAQKSNNLTHEQNEFIKTLKYQLEYLLQIQKLQNKVSSNHFEKLSYPFFKDFSNAKSFNQKDKEYFNSIDSQFTQLEKTYRSNEKIYIAFRDNKGRVRNYNIPINEFKASLSSKKQDDLEIISFKSNEKLVTINGRTITESKEVDGAESLIVYKNVTFLYPNKITKSSVLNAISPYQQLLFQTVNKVNNLPKTIFSEEYYQLIAELKQLNSYSDIQLLNLYEILLSPFIRMFESYYNGDEPHSFINKATKDLIDKINNINKNLRNLQREIRSSNGEDLNNFNNQFKKEIARLDFTPIEKFIKTSLEILKLTQSTIFRKYQCIGIATFKDKKISFIKGEKASIENNEIWILDSNGNTMLAGLCSDGKIIWNDLNFQQNHTSIVFIPNDNIDINKMAMQYKDTLTKIGVKAIYWPNFFPLNARNEQ